MSEDMQELIDSYTPSANKVGDAGEVVTASKLRSDCNMTIIRSIYLPYKGHLTEIDMIGVSPLGVFVIENKNYKGTIRGSFDDTFWKVEYSPFRTSKLYNPIKQNEIHRCVVKGLLQSLEYSVCCFNSVIFNDCAKLCISNVEKNVFTLSDFVKTYNEIKAKGFIAKEEIDKLASLFRLFSDGSDLAKETHVNLLRRWRESYDI